MNHSKPGMSLIEIMIVIAIIGILMSFIWPRIRDAQLKAKEFQAQNTLMTIQQAITEYDLDMGRVPTTRETLDVLIEQKGQPNWRGPYLRNVKEIPLDPWNHEIEYYSPPVENKAKYQRYEIISRGANPDDSRTIHRGE